MVAGSCGAIFEARISIGLRSLPPRASRSRRVRSGAPCPSGSSPSKKINPFRLGSLSRMARTLFAWGPADRKIHLARETDTQLYYEGSIGVGKELMEAAGLVAGEKVQVLNFNNSQRFETYVIEGIKGEICLRGPAARLGKKGDKVIIIAYGQAEPKEAKAFTPRVVHVNDRNEIK